jgi:hypothetical protein
MNEIKSSKFSAIIGCIFIVVGFILLFVSEGSDNSVKFIFIIGGILLMNVSTLIENQIKLQTDLIRIEGKIDKRANNSKDLEK